MSPGDASAFSGSKLAGSTTRGRRFLFAVLTVVGSITLLLGLAEGVLRFLPVASGMPTVLVTTEDPVFHYMPDRDFVFSRDWDMVMVNRGHINNVGFVTTRIIAKVTKPPCSPCLEIRTSRP